MNYMRPIDFFLAINKPVLLSIFFYEIQRSLKLIFSHWNTRSEFNWRARSDAKRRESSRDPETLLTNIIIKIWRKWDFLILINSIVFVKDFRFYMIYIIFYSSGHIFEFSVIVCPRIWEILKHLAVKFKAIYTVFSLKRPFSHQKFWKPLTIFEILPERVSH